MNMKAYTDIEQSNKLAEILPLESADMHYATWTILDGEFIVSPNQGSTIKSLQEDYGNQIISCWSLAALLELLPKEINVLGTIYSIDIHANNKKWFIDYKCNNEEFVGVYSSSLVDAAFEMITKLKENNLL